jgi:hypothetical protein
MRGPALGALDIGVRHPHHTPWTDRTVMARSARKRACLVSANLGAQSARSHVRKNRSCSLQIGRRIASVAGDITAHFLQQGEPVVLTADLAGKGWTSGHFGVKVPVPIHEGEILTSRECPYRVTPQLPFCRSQKARRR